MKWRVVEDDVKGIEIVFAIDRKKCSKDVVQTLTCGFVESRLSIRSLCPRRERFFCVIDLERESVRNQKTNNLVLLVQGRRSEEFAA